MRKTLTLAAVAAAPMYEATSLGETGTDALATAYELHGALRDMLGLQLAVPANAEFRKLIREAIRNANLPADADHRAGRFGSLSFSRVGTTASDE